MYTRFRNAVRHIFTKSLHPSERARLAREAHLDPETRDPLIVPGSFEESEALAMIDALRAEERGTRGDTFERRQARSKRYWKRHALDV